jgi:hypothetical protein
VGVVSQLEIEPEEVMKAKVAFFTPEHSAEFLCCDAMLPEDLASSKAEGGSSVSEFLFC